MNEYQINVALNGRFMFRTDWEQDKQRACAVEHCDEDRQADA